MPFCTPILTHRKVGRAKRISPNWYVLERIHLGLMRALQPCLVQVTGIMHAAFVERSKEFFDANRYRSSTELISRGFEFIDKFSISLRLVKKIVDGVQSRSKIKDLRWPVFDFEDTEKRLNELRADLLKLLGKIVPILGTMPDDPAVPDFFGQSYVKVLEETFAALVRDDDDFFKEFFPISLIGGMTAFDKLQEHVTNWDHTVAFAVRADVLIDVIELGSYAKFFSEYRGKSHYWDVCVASWDSFLASHPNSKAIIDYIINLVNLRENQSISSPRKVYRLRWEQELMSRLRREGSLIDAVYLPDHRPRSHPHPSKLVRRICSTGGLGIGWPGPDLFLIAYFEIHRKSEKPIQIHDQHGIRGALGDGVATEFGDSFEE